ncbi:4'-phosphopantetheinyl transferase superfamily protein [Halochromatium glycolicum]|uniref:4'-phosphopantetheinyl transferase superfamily protein n=1 Tax=Halochromatium glycolicum TaxID=85075 RepID=UPI00190A028E
MLIGTRLLLARIALEPDETTQADLLEALPADERARISRFRQMADQMRAITAAILPRLAIHRLHGVPLDQIALPRSSAGKPCYPDDPDFHFNLSHSGEYVGLGIGGAPLGVDCEQIRADRDQDAIARRFFTPDEQRWLAEFSSAERAQRFFELWSRKESLLKATGVGLSGSLASFDARPSRDRGTEVRVNGQRWFICSYSALQGYSVALCSAQPDLPSGPQVIDARSDPLDRLAASIEILLASDCAAATKGLRVRA